jgi:hypothetical protein
MYLDKITNVGYATVIEANGGEEQLTILATTRQDGNTALAIVGTQVDGENKSFYNDLIRTNLVLDAVRVVAVYDPHI